MELDLRGAEDPR